MLTISGAYCPLRRSPARSRERAACAAAAARAADAPFKAQAVRRVKFRRSLQAVRGGEGARAN
jgi:hypothetical protein